jgi:hypothetical protein
MKQYTPKQLQENLDEILQEVQAGSPVEILRDGRAIAILFEPDVFESVQQSTADIIIEKYLLKLEVA